MGLKRFYLFFFFFFLIIKYFQVPIVIVLTLKFARDRAIVIEIDIVNQ